MTRYLLILLLLLPACSDSDAWMGPAMLGGGVAAVASCADSSCSGFIICQNFGESGSGYDNSETPLEVVASGGVVDEDDTTATILRGGQQVKIVGGSSASSRLYFPGPDTSTDWADQSTIWVHFRMKSGSGYPSSSITFIALHNSSDTTIAYIDGRSSNDIRYYHGSSYVTTSSNDIFAANTKKHFWIKYVAGTGANGVLEVYLSATEDRPATPTYSLSNGTATTAVAGMQFIEYNNVWGGIYIDQVLVSASEIGDVCE